MSISTVIAVLNAQLLRGLGLRPSVGGMMARAEKG